MRIAAPFRLALLAPLALAAVACSDGDDAVTEFAAAEPVEAVPPPAGQQWTDVVSTTDQGGYVMGNPDAPIRLVEYGSLTCGACANFAEQSGEALRSDYIETGKVSFELRNFVRDPIDITGAILTRCGAPESFFALSDQFWENQESFFENMQQAGEQAYQAAIAAPDDQRYVMIAEATGMLEFFAARGISRDQAIACLQNPQTAQQLAQQTEQQANQYNITGTPSFLVNNRKVDALSWADLETVLQQAGAR